jgi:hypothetical protein
MCFHTYFNFQKKLLPIFISSRYKHETSPVYTVWLTPDIWDEMRTLMTSLSTGSCDGITG